MEGIIILGIIALLSPVYTQLSDIDVACGNSQPLQLQTAKGDIYSPGYQENRKYPPNTKCSFSLQVPKSKKVLLEIKFMDIEASELCSIHFLKIENPEQFITFGQYCGSNLTEKMLITTEHLMITFQSDYIVYGKGFHLTYEVTSETSLCAAKQLECKNNKCVPSFAICNQKDDCGDATDEENCGESKNQRAECGIPKIPPVLDNSFERIVGGQEAMPGSWPWQVDLQVAIYHPSGHVCGGSLLNSQWIVTAAHCVIGLQSAEKMRIVLGKHNKYSNDPHEQIRYGRNIEAYHYVLTEDGGIENIMNDDIALIKLSAEVDFTSHVSPICLPPPGFEIQAGTICFSTGWGLSRGSGGSSVLKQVPQKIVTTSECVNPFFQLNQNTMICADSYENNGGVCHMDSGGPLVCQVDKKWYLIGITSFGTATTSHGGVCGVKNIPTIYQKVSSKTTWIQNIIETDATP